MTDVEILGQVLSRILYLQRLRDTADLDFKFAGRDSKLRLRASIVAKAVADRLDRENGPFFRRDLTMALKGAGWRSVTVGNVRLWKGVSPK